MRAQEGELLLLRDEADWQNMDKIVGENRFEALWIIFSTEPFRF